MEISFGDIAAFLGIGITAVLIIALAVVKWLDKRIARVEDNVAERQNGGLKEFIAKQEKRHRAVCRRQNKFEKLMKRVISEIRISQGERTSGKLRTRKDDFA